MLGDPTLKTYKLSHAQAFGSEIHKLKIENITNSAAFKEHRPS